MRVTPLPEHQSEALIETLPFAPLAEALIRAAQAPGLELHEGHGRSVWCQGPMGEFGAKKRGEGVLLFARAHDPADLAALQQSLSDLLPKPPRWSSPADAGAFPANFTLARLEAMTSPAPGFLRLRLATARAARFGHSDSLHFRLVLPAPGIRPIRWPELDARGQTLWPKGDAALHRPALTTCAVDAAAGWIETDVFLHTGGRLCQWLATARIGDELGLAGPSGGGIPEGGPLYLAGDETAYPAIARILAARSDTGGEVWLLGKSPDYPMPRPQGFTFHHLPEEGAEALLPHLRQMTVPPDGFFWMAGPRSQIDTLRRVILDERAIPTRQTHLSAYWNDLPPAPAQEMRDSEASE